MATQPPSYAKAGQGMENMSASDYQSKRERDLATLRKEMLVDTQAFEKELIADRFNFEEEKIKLQFSLKVKAELEDEKKRQKRELKAIEDEYKARKKYQDKAYADRLVQLKKEQELQKEYDEARQETWKETTSMLKRDLSQLKIGSLFKDIKSSFFTRSDTTLQNWDSLVSSISTLSKKLDTQIDTIASYQGKLDTRLLGSGRTFENGLFRQGISSWVTGIAGMSPYVSQATIMTNVNSLVEKGIAYNVEQRAFLQSIAENIATTFNAANGTLLRIIRIQQADSTASRLGLEGQLNYYLNAMYKNTEYMSDLYKSVTENLYEATTQFSSTDSIGFEYQVQKWLGSLYSSGLSNTAVSNISSALGMLGSGNVSGLSGSAMQNLLVMSAARAGLSYSDLLTGGLSADSTNKLMASMVTYLADIASSGNNVVRSQYANVFGLSLSDLKAMRNVASQVGTISGQQGGYGSAISSLYNLAGSMWTRMSVGQQMNNMWENVLYSMSSGIASNPVLYAILKSSDLLKSATGGISIPDFMTMGTGVSLNTTVADLMRVGALGGGILSSIASMIGGGGGLSTSGMISKILAESAGSNLPASIVRGSGMSILSGTSTSQSSYVGSSSASDIKSSAIASADEQRAQTIQGKTDEDTIELKDVNENIVKIYELLDSVVSGGAIKVSPDESAAWPWYI